MLMHEATPEMIDTWKSVYNENKTRLVPNRKSAQQMIEYLKGKYSVSEITNEKCKQVVLDNVLSNKCHADKLPAGKKPKAVVYIVQNANAGTQLYENQDELFKGQSIIVGIELETGFFHVEGSSELCDELFAYRGLDKIDLNNFYLVAEYVACLLKLDMLNEALVETK